MLWGPPDIKLLLLLLHHCNSAAVMKHNVNNFVDKRAVNGVATNRLRTMDVEDGDNNNYYISHEICIVRKHVICISHLLYA